MSDTRERILMTALRLFAKDGYEAVSVSQIAGELGMTKGALYKHFKNKRDIFDSIVARMVRQDHDRALAYDVPPETAAEGTEAYRRTALADFKRFTLAQYGYWVGDEFAAAFRKMLALEQYRSPEMGALYQSCLVSGPVAYTADVFEAMMEEGLLRRDDPQRLAVAYFAPLLLLIQMADGEAALPNPEETLEALIDQFFARYGAEGGENA